MASYKEFVKTITRVGLARTNRFQVIIPMPSKLTEDPPQEEEEEDDSIFKTIKDTTINLVKDYLGIGEVTRGLDIMCEQTEMPGKNFTTEEVKYNGDTYKLPNGVIYGIHQFVFKCATDMKEKIIIDDWMDVVLGTQTQQLNYMKHYVSNIEIYQLNQYDEPVYGVVLKNAFPISSNPLTLSNSETNNTHSFMVQFAYSRWEPIDDLPKKTGIRKLAESAFGPIVTPILANPAVAQGLDYLSSQGLDLEGEAVNIYNQVDSILQNTTGTNLVEAKGMLESIKADTAGNDLLSTAQQIQLGGIIDGTLNKMQ